MSESNYRLVDHLVEMKRADNQTMPGKVIFRTTKEDVSIVDQEAYWMDIEKWQSVGQVDEIHVTVTAVVPAAEEESEEPKRELPKHVVITGGE